ARNRNFLFGWNVSGWRFCSLDFWRHHWQRFSKRALCRLSFRRRVDDLRSASRSLDRSESGTAIAREHRRPIVECAVRLVSKFLRYWLPLVIWLIMIFIGSTDLMSAEHTSRIIGPILRWLHPGISLARIEQVQFVVRKMAHVSEYAVLALLIFRALVNMTRRARFAGAVLITLLISGAFAASDEFHQSFVASRTSSVRDVLIDVTGAILGMTIYRSFLQKTKVRIKA